MKYDADAFRKLADHNDPDRHDNPISTNEAFHLCHALRSAVEEAEQLRAENARLIGGVSRIMGFAQGTLDGAELMRKCADEV